jgi:cbb3-type cytochrome oxidase subunit 3
MVTDLYTALWNTIAMFLTFCIFSFLYKDNPFYKVAEHIVVGVSAGYFAVILYWNGLKPKLWEPVFIQGKWYYLIPGILGVMMWTRFSKKYAWISRLSIAFYMGIATGVEVPLYIQNYVIRQLSSTMLPVHFQNTAGIFNLLIILGVLCALVYFFFSKEHKGAMGSAAKVGIWTLMVGFGAGFGVTVMGRVSLLIDRVIFLRNYFDSFFTWFIKYIL